MRPFDWKRDLHPASSLWWTSERMGYAALVWSLLFAFLIGVAVGS